MINLKAFELGVTDLVSFVFREGSIDTRGGGKARMQLGTKIHQEIQEKDQKRKQDYKKEVYFKFIHIHKEYAFTLTGRADAVYKKNNRPVIEEIKTTYKFKSSNFSPQRTHLAQLYFYGFFYMMENNLKEIDLSLHYYHIVSKEHSYFNETKTLEELSEYVDSVLDLWLDMGYFQSDWIRERNESIDKLSFIYDNFRPGQREISLAVFNTIKRKNKALIEAPTGIGKTLGTIFPSIKLLPNNEYKQIYYLTAKTTIQKEANKALNQLRENGLKIKSTTITARDKICFLNQKDPNTRSCNPEDCKFAQDYFTKINNILSDSLKAYSHFDRELIEKIALENEVCPYQLTLDLCNWSDIVICDYNYIFDPVSALEGYNQSRVCLIDEAHNLPDRSRNMYSAQLDIYTFKKLRNVLNKKEVRKEKENNRLKRQVNRVIRFLTKLKDDYQTCEDENVKIDKEILSGINLRLFQFQTAAFRYINQINDKKIEIDPEVLKCFNDCTSEVYRFNVITDYALENDYYYNYLKLTEKGIIVRLACLDASKYLSNKLKESPTVLFSATLTPFDYYSTVLLGEEDIPTIALPSPFSRENYRVFCDDSISTRYNDRKNSYEKIAQIIKTFISARKGNYLIFFPSYNYLHTVYEIFVKLVKNEDLNVLIQNPEMDEAERETFLDNFKTKQSTIGFCVMGGIFSEGVDLPLEALIGTLIVGPGVPGVDFERDLIKNYFQKENGNGYAYAYAYPGMNRVLQSAGRVIRTDQDRGIILLIDDRFKNPFYKKMIPNHLKPDYLNNSEELGDKLQEFWRKN